MTVGATAGGATVRPGTPGDVLLLARLRHEFRTELAASEEDPEGFVARCAGWMRPRLESGAWRVWVAEGDGTVLGTVWIGLIEKMPNPIAEPEEHGYLTSFYVRPHARGRGVGTALLDAALGWCRDRGVHAVILWPTQRTRALYERHGFGPPGALMERVVTGESAPWPTARGTSRGA